jgi:glucose-6-phosphate isomerase
MSTSLGLLAPQVIDGLAAMDAARIVERIWSVDHTVWKPEPTEIANRLGWLAIMAEMRGKLAAMQALVDDVRAAGYRDVLLLGMGGSSLAPEVFSVIFGVAPGYLNLAVLDSTDPDAVLAAARRFEPATTLYVVSTKSGGTVETASFFKYFFNRAAEVLGVDEAGRHFVAITDPGSGLADWAKEHKFRATLLNNPNIGGRYSVLSSFGLLPAALLGIDVSRLLDRAQAMADGCRQPAPNNPGAWLGTVMGCAAKEGIDKVTFIASPAVAHFGLWVEQLIAESTGKEGLGVLPVDLEPLGAPAAYRSDRLFAYLRLAGDATYDNAVTELAAAGHPVIQLDLADAYDVAAEFFRWEFATAIAGYWLAINPFDQPNVESAKIVARAMVAAYQKTGALPVQTPLLVDDAYTLYTTSVPAGAGAAATLGALLATGVGGRDYVSIHAYIVPSPAADAALTSLRVAIRDATGMATTVGYGPRFLHSTGQLHKGDGGNGIFIQFSTEHVEDAAIPDSAGSDATSISFGVLVMAQTLGDAQALRDNGRRLLRIHLAGDAPALIGRLASAL